MVKLNVTKLWDSALIKNSVDRRDPGEGRHQNRRSTKPARRDASCRSGRTGDGTTRLCVFGEKCFKFLCFGSSADPAGVETGCEALVIIFVELYSAMGICTWFKPVSI